MFVTSLSENRWTIKMFCMFITDHYRGRDFKTIKWMNEHFPLTFCSTVHETISKSILEAVAQFFYTLAIRLYRSEHETFVLIICQLENIPFLPPPTPTLRHVLLTAHSQMFRWMQVAGFFLFCSLIFLAPVSKKWASGWWRVVCNLGEITWA